MPDLIIERLDPSLPMPKYAKEGDAGFDLCYYAADMGRADFRTGDLSVGPHQMVKIHTGIRAQIPEGYEVQIRPRSGKTGEGLVAQFGTVDAGYRGWWYVNLLNTSGSNIFVYNFDRIAQAVLAPVTRASIVEGVVSVDTERGEGGFGSTGR